MNNKNVFSTRLLKGSRSYFFDIQQSTQGKLYLCISESRKTDEGYTNQRVFVFDEDMKDFIDTLRDTLTKYKELKELNPTNGPANN